MLCLRNRLSKLFDIAINYTRMSFSDEVEMATSPNLNRSPSPATEVYGHQMLPHLSRMDLNKVIMNYLVTEGYKEASRLFGLETGIPLQIPLESLDNRMRVRDAIENGRMIESIAMIRGFYPELLTDCHGLHFELQKQHLVELIRDRQIEDAINFAQSHLAEHGQQNADSLNELERILALLAFDEPQLSPFGDLLLDSQRLKLASKVNAAILSFHNEDSNTRITDFYKLLLWAQHELDQRKVQYEKMTDLGSATLESSVDASHSCVDGEKF